MALEQQRLSPQERANLVAYLDGELNEAEARAIGTKLSLSPTARQEVAALERTWELLEQLPRPKAPDDFTERTLTEVHHLEEAGGRLESVVMRTVVRGARAALWVGGSALAFGVGFLLTQWVWPNPTARLARDLTVAEHLDEYRDVGDFEFLKELANSPEFGTDHDD
jgi:anti-sigma factor RsiW